MATLKDIAVRAGVSVGTVDRILHNRGRFSEETAANVRKIAEELDYRPNMMARQLSRATRHRVVVLMPEASQDSSYWSLPLSGIRKAAEELEPFGLDVEIRHFDRYRSGSFGEAVSRINLTGADGFLVAPLEEYGAREFLSGLDGKVPVVLFDTDLPDAGSTHYVGQDSRQSGRLAAKLMILLAGADSEVLIVTPFGGKNVHMTNRIGGFRECYPGRFRDLVVNVESDHDEDKYMRQLDEACREAPGGIYVTDASAHYAARYLAGRPSGGQDGKIPLIGFDLVPENRRWVKEGIIDFLLTQRPVQQGYDGVRYLFRTLVMNEEIPEQEYLPIDIVTRENLEYLTPREEK